MLVHKIEEVKQKVKEWKKGESLTLEKFDDYYRDVNLDTVIFKIMPNESAQEIAFENGELNIIRVSTIDKYEKYAANDNYEMVTLDEGRINYIAVLSLFALRQKFKLLALS